MDYRVDQADNLTDRKGTAQKVVIRAKFPLHAGAAAPAQSARSPGRKSPRKPFFPAS